MLKIPSNDILIAGLCIGLIGGFILSKNYFPINAETEALEGRLQFGGNSFDVKNKIISKYNAWIGFTLFAVGIIINILYVFLQKYATFADLKGRSIFFGSTMNTLTTIAALMIMLRLSVFLTDFLSRKEYFPFLQKRELDNFTRAIKDLNEQKTSPDAIQDSQREIDQQLALFDIKAPKNYTYDMKIRILKEKIFIDIK